MVFGLIFSRSVTMHRLAIIVAVSLIAAAPALAAETRCGWYMNPTPGNLWLMDKDATWTITSQANATGPDAEGIENAPDFDETQFVETNNPGSGYGYGCACMSVTVDKAEEQITRIFSGEIKPLSVCKADKSLPSPD
ncbi:hypothetical protein VW23_007040 [Devosia insulae DS-56]|uniref:DUF4087 domain-containing protein n=1 Tax=Devosia insulae DS-56 TaxID=1116389 RepID=A0A1E5XH82_9HYPH|nr:DUF4087 domain-containing protein [Devosia insulae]OEO27952.1 hypothetical protein VW23_007040 [Devosia insulae DS-56]